MAKNGYKIFDSDTHVGPQADILERYLSAADRERLQGFAEFRRENRRTGHFTYNFNTRQYTRRIGDPEARPAVPGEYMTGFTAQHKQPPNPLAEDDPAERLKDMDLEGVDVNLLLPSGWFGVWTSQPDLALESSQYAAYHRWMDDYCAPFPDRLTGVILCSCRDVESAVSEINRWGKSRWAMAVFAYAPFGKPLDHPDLEPIWSAAAEHDLSVVLHTFTVAPPYAPGGLDTWDNLWLQRSAAHPWCGMRNMASIIGSGVMDRYPELRVGVLEAGHGWLPFWIKRLDEHAHSIAAALPPLKHKPSEYVASGRYFQSIEMSEGEDVTMSVIDLLGEDILMYASDYPHGESWFPISVDTVMGWERIPERAKKKLFWDNAVNFYRRYDSG
ncbi:MAG: amidohydrolase [Chloroflexi bacterium]|nr:amidohydrolase [Chloroflexota bacterium]